MHAISKACTYSNEDTSNDNQAIGVSNFYLFNHIFKPTVEKFKFSNVQQKECSENEWHRIIKNSILTFCHYEEASVIGYNSHRAIDIIVSGFTEKHVGRVWNVITIDERCDLCCKSDAIEDFIRKYPNFKISSRSHFHRNSCPYARKPLN